MERTGEASGRASAGCEVRSFEERDFGSVMALYPPEWRFEGATAEEKALQESMDCASLLAECNLRLVAEASPGGGAPAVVGVALARSAALPALPAAEAARWEGVAAKGRAGLEASGSPASRRMLAYIDQLEDRARLLEEAAGEARGPDNELVLFVVGPAARGHGAGSALIASVEGALRSAGQASYWLQTDSRCTWQWYPRHGYERVADVALDARHPMPDAPVPGMPGSAGEAPHVFMYRKDVRQAAPAQTA